MLCYIFDDQYGKIIYTGLQDNSLDLPIQDNIFNPLDYLEEVIEKEPDWILLDNYFPNRTSGREEPLWDEFLQRLLTYNINTKVLCISDYGEKLTEKYDWRKQWVQSGLVRWFIASKDAKEIKKALM